MTNSIEGPSGALTDLRSCRGLKGIAAPEAHGCAFIANDGPVSDSCHSDRVGLLLPL